MAVKSGTSWRSRMLLSAAGASALAMTSGAVAQNVTGPPRPLPDDAVVTPQIVGTDGLTTYQPAPAGILDTGITGIGEVDLLRPSGVASTCTGTLINPRTVLLAAHCVNAVPAQQIGAARGGLPMSVGFEDYNTPAFFAWLNPGANQFRSNPAQHLYNVEQVWYDPASLSSGSGFASQSDVALATLDTPATGIPTWAMLFTPLTGETHATIVGYGNTSNGFNGGTTGASGFDRRRRAAENMVSVLASLDTVYNTIFGEPAEYPQSFYMLDFDSPGTVDARTSEYDFDIFGGDALSREGGTARGDSGGPLIIDRKYGRSVIAGVLSFGQTFYPGQPDSSYGSISAFQPLFLEWDAIVANNPYVYARAKVGNAEWTDPAHWVQAMDPSYLVDRNGALVNALPGQLGQRASADVTNFGRVCFLDDCQDVANGVGFDASKGAGLRIAGGPGSTNSVPDNRAGDPATGRPARYYDVTLNAPGTTSVSGKITIDRLTLAGAARLNIRSDAGSGPDEGGRPAGDLRVLTDFTQWNGETRIDGGLATSEALIAGGLLTGRGTIDPTYLTIGRAIVSPGDLDAVGTLTIKGDVILSSGAITIFNVARSQADLLSVKGDAVNPGAISLGGVVQFTPVPGAMVRDSQTFTIITADGGVTGTFGAVGGGIGVLRPSLAYGSGKVDVTFRAGRFADYLSGGGTVALAFGRALDALRETRSGSLAGLYGTVDLLAPQQLAATFSSLSPAALIGRAGALQDSQSRFVRRAIGDRLSMLGTGALAGQLSIVGSPNALLDDIGGRYRPVADAAQESFVANMAGGTRSIGRLPDGISGFVASGVSAAGAPTVDGSGAGQGQTSWHLATGAEVQVASATAIGAAFSHSAGRDLGDVGSTWGVSDTTALYGSHRLGGGFYGAGVASIEAYRIDSDRRTLLDGAGVAGRRAATATSTLRLHVEAGTNVAVTTGLTLTPRVALDWAGHHTKGYREGAGESALIVNGRRVNRLEARAGARLAGRHEIASGWALVPDLQTDLVSRVSGDAGGLSVRFAAAPDFVFALPAGSLDRRWVEIRGGVQLVKGPISFGTAVQSTTTRDQPGDDRAVVSGSLRF